MTELLLTLLPFLLVDVLNPVLFAMLVFAAGSNRPVANSAALLGGHTLAYLLAGVVISFGLERVAERLANPQAIDFVIGGIIGLVLLFMAIPTNKKGAPTAPEPEWELTPLKCIGFGAVVNFVGIPFAVPYFAAVDQVLKADLSMSESFAVLVIYNIAYAVPFLVVPVLVAITGDKAKPLLERINGYLSKAADFAMPWMFGLLGLALLADSIAFFWRGEGLIQF